MSIFILLIEDNGTFHSQVQNRRQLCFCHLLKYSRLYLPGSESFEFDSIHHSQGLTGSRYPTRPELFFKYPTHPDPKIENDWVPGN